MTNNCKFIESGFQCKHNCKYGDFCYKHRREHLISDNEINRDRFTGVSKDYLKKDLVEYQKNIWVRKI